MLSPTADHIVAIATAPGRGAVGIVRVSGRDVTPLARALTGRALAPRVATFGPFREADGSPIDHGLAIHFPAPHSYTGEDVLELQAHGGPVVLQLLLQRCLQAAAETDPTTGAERLPHLVWQTHVDPQTGYATRIYLPDSGIFFIRQSTAKT